MCESKARCEHDLDRGADPSAWHAYCPIDHTLHAPIRFCARVQTATPTKAFWQE